MIIVMIRKIKTHILFLLLMYVIYIISCLVYSRSFSNILEALVYYVVLTFILFLIDRIESKKIKWLIVGIVCVLATFIVVLGASAPDFSSFYLLQITAQIYIPFLPDIYNYSDVVVIRFLTKLLLLLYLPFLYYYILFKIVKYYITDK